MTEPHAAWTIADANELYEVERWGARYFSIGSDGDLRVHPDRDPDKSVRLKSLIDQIAGDGLELPLLLRFNGILRDRLAEIHDCFSRAISEHDYGGQYQLVFPIKVNQQYDVVRKIVQYGREFGFGLEAGSKPELLAVVAMGDESMPIVCNGFKDDEFIRMAMMAQKLGRTVLPVVEKYSELELILDQADQIGVRPQIGVRVKLASRGAGRWQSSGGYRSKFGLTVSEVLQLVGELESRQMSDCFKLLHFHLGSQITNIRLIKAALNEAVRIYVDLHQRGLGLQYFNVGGGLGVDYDGSQTNFESSINYTLQEYANDVIYQIQTVCDEAHVPHPTILSESGRAVAAYHSVLVFGTLGVSAQGNPTEVPTSIPHEYEQPLQDLVIARNDLTSRNMLEIFHDAQQALDMAMNLFSSGYLPLEQRVLAENLFFAIAHSIQKLVADLDYVPEDLRGLPRMLADSYFCNFSLFQSIPDSWAINQLFPIMPIHRLDERPSRQAVLCDITCDSDGKVDRFVDRRDTRRTLSLHEANGEPYYMGAFLVGAYQEILGDLHNLFGDTHALHINLLDDGNVEIETIVKGDTVREVLGYVQYDEQAMVDRLRESVDAAQSAGRINENESQRFTAYYRDRLAGYTYLKS